MTPKHINKCYIVLYPNRICYPQTPFCVLYILTSVGEECTTDPSQQGQRDQIPQTGSYRGGHIIRVDAHFSGTNDDSNHHQA